MVGLVDQTTGAARGFHVTHATGDTIRDILFTNVTRRSRTRRQQAQHFLRWRKPNVRGVSK